MMKIINNKTTKHIQNKVRKEREMLQKLQHQIKKEKLQHEIKMQTAIQAKKKNQPKNQPKTKTKKVILYVIFQYPTNIKF